MTYCARVRGETDSPDIVVKFVARYGIDAHNLLAQEGYAPRLQYYGPLDGKYTMEDVPHMEAPPVLSCGPMQIQMVVMDYVVRSEIPPGDFHQQISNILTGLHIMGYVFGDL